MKEVSMCGYLLYVSNCISNKKINKYLKDIETIELENLYLLLYDELEIRKNKGRGNKNDKINKN